MDKFSQLAFAIGSTVKDLIGVRANYIKITRLNKVITACQIVQFQVDSEGRTIQLDCIGWQDLLYKMRLQDNFDFEDETYGNIIWGLINHWQSQGANYNHGFTQGQVSTTGTASPLNDRDKNIGDAIIEFTEVENGPDIYIDPNKVVNVYDRRGSQRDDIILTYPGNITRMSLLVNGQPMANYQITIGAGTGEDALRTTSEAVAEEGIYGVMQDVGVYNDVDDETTIQLRSDGDLQYSKSPAIILDMELDGNLAPSFGSYNVGDAVYIKMAADLTAFSDANGLVRVEGFDVDVLLEDQENVRLKAAR